MMFGHVKFDMGNQPPLSFVQGKDAGNQVRTICFCDRCCVSYVEKSEMSAEQLAKEAEAEKVMANYKDKLKKTEEDLIKRFTELKVQTKGKVEIN
jgi:hypothetical protein